MREGVVMPMDAGLIGALHVECFRERDIRVGEHLHHTLFQTSTIDALLDGRYEGDVSFAELEAHGDFGLGTFEALDGEMIGLDGAFYQVKSDGRAYEVDKTMKTPFAVVT
ncbi:MAG: acetolactate decarboxylase, partial [Rubrobacteraceae bacterium]